MSDRFSHPAGRPWHVMSVEDCQRALEVEAATGLSDADARLRLELSGPNELVERRGRGPLAIVWDQVSSTMVLILVVAAVISGLLGKSTEMAAIGAIVVLFTVLGFVQEFRAERAMAALKSMARPLVRARRAGRAVEIPARELVPGDVVLLEAGSIVPADVRLVYSAALRIQESALTGESEPVEKDSASLDKPDAPLGDRRNLGFMGTAVTLGRAEVVVIGTGMRTELGRIAELIQSVVQGQTPLQRRLDKVGQALAVVGVAVAALVMLIGVLQGESLADMFLTAVSVAVAVVPEGLPAVVTVTLALGAQRMLRRKALIRKLPAVETLGSVTTICSDKTGTLTENRMTVTVIDVAGRQLDLKPAAAAEGGGVQLGAEPAAIAGVLAGGLLCNDAVLSDADAGTPAVLGDPTEGALLVAAAKAGLSRKALEEVLPRVRELPFDSERKRMSTLHRLPSRPEELDPALHLLHDGVHSHVALTKGAVDGMLEVCDRLWTEEGPRPLDADWRERIQSANDGLAANGMRVLGVALDWVDEPGELREQGLVFLGLVSMIDPPRPEVKAAVRTCVGAGIRPMMITGDHPLTARFIAHELGMSGDGRVVTGQELARMSPEELATAVREVSVFARVAPEHKLRIVESLQNQGQVVAMTGDGVNDSPALRKADIGVAMGITGTDVSKEASDMVLVDDNFATIVAAVEEGRVIYANVRRFVKFSIAGNLGKVLVMLLAPLAGIAVALLPLQLLWLNLLTDGLLGLGLGLEPPGPGVMKKRPRPPGASFFPAAMLKQLLWVGTLIGLLALGLGLYVHQPGEGAGERWQTMIFTSLAFLQVGQALASRSSTASLFSLGLFSNKPLMLMVGVTVALQLTVLYVPVLDPFFQITPLSAPDLAVCVGLGVLLFAVVELEKWVGRRRAEAAAGGGEEPQLGAGIG